MALSIKNGETERLAREVARRNGETVTTAVKIALKQRLERQEKAENRESRMQWLDRITNGTAAMMNDGRTSRELIDELYDEETGLPK